jgi:pyridoxine kinase
MDLEAVHTLLSIQSHVVHGYVGNKSSTFPLQCQGWDVDALNTVNFSNHTGYGSIKGTQGTAEEITSLFEGVKTIGVKYDALLTGYVAGAESLEAVGAIGLELKSKNENCLWLLDPVMGDEGKLYVSEKVIPIYQKLLTRGGIDIITPNQFEAELIVGYKIDCEETLKRALSDLHTKFKVPNVVISSLNLEPNDQSKECKLLTVTSISLHDEVYSSVFEVPYIESYFTGVGDLFSALLLDRVYKFNTLNKEKTKDFLNEAVNEVLSVMSQVLRVTSQAAQQTLGKSVKSQMGSAATMKECELRLVQCRDLYSSNEKKFISRLI